MSTFTERLRSASKKEHSVSDSLVAARLVLATTEKRLWGKALASFWHIFSAFERAIDAAAADCPDLKLLQEFLPRVRRKEAYEADLIVFYGPEFQRRIGPPTEAVQTYLHRIAAISEKQPHLLIAHAYTQHMAMLAGGQSMRNSVRRALQMAPPDPGTAAFEFKEPAKKLRAEYKELVNVIGSKLGEKKSQEVIDEHRLVFKLNNDIIRTFPVSVGGSITGVIKLIPVEILLIIFSLVSALIFMYVTRDWIVVDPDASSFADPDFVQQ